MTEVHDTRPRTENVVLDIGGDIGALILYTRPEADAVDGAALTWRRHLARLCTCMTRSPCARAPARYRTLLRLLELASVSRRRRAARSVCCRRCSSVGWTSMLSQRAR